MLRRLLPLVGVLLAPVAVLAALVVLCVECAVRIGKRVRLLISLIRKRDIRILLDIISLFCISTAVKAL